MNAKIKIVALAAAAALSSAAFANSGSGRFRISKPGAEPVPATAPAPAPAAAPVVQQQVVEQQVAQPAPDPIAAVAVPVADGAASAKRLPRAEQARYEAAKRWERSGVADALVGQNGAVEYAYGYSRPTISCAPLHVCTIILQEGEAITSMSLGDTVRWLAQQSTAGEKPVIVVKPTQPGISTNLVVTTDAGRVYYMHLLADSKQYVPIVSFYDPAEMMREEQSAISNARAAKLAAQALAAKKADETIASFKPGFDPAKLDFDYVCRGNDARLLPSRVFASDTQTYFQMPADMRAGDAPAVFALRGEQTELVNMRVKGGYYIIDGKPAKMKLLVGVGDEQSAVTCAHK